MTESSLLGGAEGADAEKWSESVGLNQRDTGRLGLLLQDVLGKEHRVALTVGSLNKCLTLLLRS